MSLLKSKRKTPNIIRGGRAIPFGNPTDNLYYLQGRSHAKGGIDIGENPRTGIEAEGGEVVQIKPNELRVLSAQDFIGGGISPAKQVLAGANPDRVFNNQEAYKNRHRLNDDGSKYRKGGSKIVDNVNKSNADFVDRLKTPMRKTITDWSTQYTSNPKIATHKLSVWEVDNNKGLIVPNVQNINGKLIDFTRPPYNERAGLENAIKNKDFVILNNYDDAKWYTENYKNYYPNFKNGGMITTINGNIKNGLIVTPRKKCGGRKKAPYGTVRDVNTRGVAAPDLWLNTIGQDNAVYDMAFNNTIEGNRMAMRHADMREDLGYQSGSGRAIRGSGQVRQYQQDFQNRFWDANRKLYNAIDPAGNTGDNQSGQFNDDIWGEETNVRAPYGLWSDKNRQMWNDKGFLAANYKGNTVLTGRIADLNNLELPGRPRTPQLTAPKGELLDMPSPTGGNAETPVTPQSPTPRRGIRWNDDLTSALANGLGSLGSFGAELWGANLRSWTPYTESPVKLKTNWNINPQLDRIRESSQEAYRDIDANTASSSTALARKQRVRNQAQYAANEQWGLKENKETELINKDKLNLQGVRNRNTNRLNHWAESDANIANMRRRLRGAAWSNLFDNLNKTVQGYIGRRDQRRRDEATERMFNRAYPHGAAMARNIQSRESSGDATIPSLATNPIAIAGRLATERLDDDIVAQTKKRCGGKTKRK